MLDTGRNSVSPLDDAEDRAPEGSPRRQSARPDGLERVSNAPKRLDGFRRGRSSNRDTFSVVTPAAANACSRSTIRPRGPEQRGLVDEARTVRRPSPRGARAPGRGPGPPARPARSPSGGPARCRSSARGCPSRRRTAPRSPRIGSAHASRSSPSDDRHGRGDVEGRVLAPGPPLPRLDARRAARRRTRARRRSPASRRRSRRPARGCAGRRRPGRSGSGRAAGCTASLSALPGPSGSGSVKNSPSWRTVSRRSAIETMSTYSRVRASGLANRTPCQPSETCGPETPSPSRKRPALSRSRVAAVIAVIAGVRAGICMTAGADADARRLGGEVAEQRSARRTRRPRRPTRTS